MPIRTTLCNNDFDFTQATYDDVYFAFLVKLPFRFRVGSPFHCHFEAQGDNYDIWIRNKPIEAATEPGMTLPALIRQGGKVEDLWSTVAVIPNKGGITPDELAAIQTCHGDVEKAALESLNKRLFPAMQALNAFVVGYHTATGEMRGGQRLKAMTVHEFIYSIAWEVALIGIPLAYWTALTINELFDLKAEKELRVVASLTGELSDLPADKLAGIGQAIDRLNSFYFYELAFEAKAKMVNTDYVGALLMAVAALEGAHGAYTTHVLESKLPTGRTGEDKNLEENFIKELGFSLCNKLTPYLLMDATERPSQELIQKAAKAVKYRNEIMHALRNAAGMYRIRTRTNAELSDAFSGALQLYDCYRKALEKTLSAGPTTPATGSSPPTG